jgi:acyl-CoA synthetase (AMP-forming)/AMP-acid ligase II
MSSATLLHELLDSAAGRWPYRPAVSFGEAVATYRDVKSASDRLAVALHDMGLRRGDCVVLAVPPDVLLPCVIFAASRLGVLFAVLHEQVPMPGLAHVLDDCAPALLLSDDPRAAELADARRITLRTTDQLVPVAFPTRDSGEPPALPDVAPLAVDPVCLIYTSGTTALPKAVVSTHHHVLFATAAIQAALRYRPDDVVFCALPLSFDYGLYQLFLGASSGAHVVLAPAAAAGPPLLAGLRRWGATVLPAVPSLAETLAWLAQRTSARPDRLRLLTNTGAAISARTLARLRAALPGLRVQVMYGLTECKRTAIMPPDGDLTRPKSCGRPLAGTEVLVIDDDGVRLPPGQVGEFVVRGPHVMAGYWRRPELTAQRFPRREGLFPELRTGDFGWVDDEGYLYFSGRRDDLYKERGFRVSVTEVEAAAHRVAGVVSAAALPPRDGSPATVVVVGECTAEEFLDGMREQIEPFKVPRRCFVMAELPLTGNGKVDRRRLAAMVEERAIRWKRNL